jgi:hypothetical protein
MLKSFFADCQNFRRFRMIRPALLAVALLLSTEGYSSVAHGKRCF